MARGLLFPNPRDQEAPLRSEQLHPPPVRHVADDLPGVVPRDLVGALDLGGLQRAVRDVGVEGLVRLLVGYDLEVLLEAVPDGDGRLIEARDPDDRLHELEAPGVEGARQVVRAAVVLRRGPLLPVVGDRSVVLLELDVPRLADRRVRPGAVYLPVLPVLPRDGHVLGGRVKHSLVDGVVDVAAARPRSLRVPAPAQGGGVRAAVAEGHHAGVGGVLSLEAETLCRDGAGEAVHVQMGVQAVEVAVRCALRVYAHEDGLEEATDAGTALTMPDVRLRRGDDDGRVPEPHDLPVRPDLYGVAEGGAGAVALRRVDLRRLQADLLQHGHVASLLRRPIRRHHRGAAAVLVYVAAREDREVPLRGLELLRLEAAGGRGLAAREAVGRGVVREAAADVGVHAGGAGADIRLRDEAQVDAAGDHGVHLVVVLVHQVQFARVAAHQRTRAGRVDGHARALEVHAVVEAVRADRVRVAGRPETAASVLRHLAPFVLVEAHEHRDLRRLRLELLLGMAGAHERDVGNLQDLALRRVHGLRLRRRDVEELGVEELDAVRKAAMASVGLAR
mmetsp:Transcript_30739/g.86693  ORF Transcript_30739/g.86693 Transcript_30739/m.86693 type:complete len:561 (-) Transcript_30739:1246-2928(-)